MGDTSTKLSIPILKVLNTKVSSTFKNQNFNSCDHVMLAFEVTKHNVIISINHLQKYCFIANQEVPRIVSNNIDTKLKVLGIISNENFRYGPSLLLAIRR